MERLKKILHRVLFPGVPVRILAVVAGAVLLAYAFLAAEEEDPVRYAAYVLSAYALAVLCANLVPAFKKGRALADQNPWIHRYRKDLPFKLRISLFASLGVNLLYAAVNAVSGLYYRSAWYGSLAVYYICLSVMRFLLVRYANRQGFGKDREAEWRRYRLCGCILAVMNLALVGVVILLLSREGSFDYAGMMIYVMAMYAFYATVMAIVNLIRYRKYQSPAMSAARAVSLAAALVSMLSLEVGMLNQFGAGDTTAFRESMIAVTGGVVCALVTCMGVYMTVHATRQLGRGGPAA